MSGYPSGHNVLADEFEDWAVSYTTQGTAATSTSGSGGAENAMASWSPSSNGLNTTFTFKNGYVYRLDVSGGAFNTDAAATTAKSNIRVRKGVNTTSGQELFRYGVTSRGGSDVESFAGSTYIKNVSGADISTALGITVQRASGAANNSVYGDANLPLMVTVRRIGLSASLGSGITGVAVAIV